MNSTRLITSELANQRARIVLFTCVVYTNARTGSPHIRLEQTTFIGRVLCFVSANFYHARGTRGLLVRGLEPKLRNRSEPARRSNIVTRDQGGLEALPMIQRVKVRERFHRCKQNLVRIEGHSQVFTWLLLRFGSLL